MSRIFLGLSSTTAPASSMRRGSSSPSICKQSTPNNNPRVFCMVIIVGCCYTATLTCKQSTPAPSCSSRIPFLKSPIPLSWTNTLGGRAGVTFPISDGIQRSRHARMGKYSLYKTTKNTANTSELYSLPRCIECLATSCVEARGFDLCLNNRRHSSTAPQRP